MMMLGARCKEDIQVYRSDGFPFKKKAGEYLRAIPSARITEEEFKKLAKEAGYNIVMQQSDNGVAVAVLQSKM
jgi:formylmethanofuran dehydrogenase subunit D